MAVCKQFRRDSSSGQAGGDISRHQVLDYNERIVPYVPCHFQDPAIGITRIASAESPSRARVPA